MADRFEPHDHILLRGLHVQYVYSGDQRWGGVPGVVGLWVAGWVREGYYTGYYPGLIPGPIFSIFKVKGPTHGRMKANSEVS